MGSFNLSQTNDEAAFLTGVGAIVSLYLIGNEPITSAIGYGILAGLAVLGYTGYSATPKAA